MPPSLAVLAIIAVLGPLAPFLWLRARTEHLSGLMLGLTALTYTLGFPAALLTPFEASWDALGSAVESAEYLALLHFVLAGWLLFIVVAHLQPRGTRRQRTTRAAQVLLVAILVAGFWIGNLGLVLVLPPCATGFLWLQNLNRRGNGTLAQQKERTAGLLVASSVQLSIAIAHRTLAGSLVDPSFMNSFLESIGIGSLLIGALVAGLRYLAGGVQRWPIAGSVATAITLASPLAWYSVRDRPTKGLEMAEWIDLQGHRGPPLRAATDVTCLQTGPTRPSCNQPLAAPPPTTPLSEVPNTFGMLVDSTLPKRIPRWGRFGDPLHIDSTPNGTVWKLDHRGGTVKTLEELHDVLENTRRPLVMTRSPHATFQDFVSACASTGPDPQCTLQ